MHEGQVGTRVVRYPEFVALIRFVYRKVCHVLDPRGQKPLSWLSLSGFRPFGRKH